MGIPESGSGPLSAYVVPAAREGGIWASPGPVITADGTLLVATGNSAAGGAFDRGNAVLRLSPTLQEVDAWAPAEWAALSNADADIGSSAPVPLPDGLVFQAGKPGRGYLLRADHLGGVGGEAFSAPVCASGAWGGVAHDGDLLYVPCLAGIVALHVSGGRFDVAWRAEAGGETPVLAYGRLWSVARAAGRLEALDPDSGAVAGGWPIGPLTAHFTTPAAAGGRVFVSGSTRVYAFAVAS